MKKSLRNLVHKSELSGSKQLEGGFTVLANIRGGNISQEVEVAINDFCTGTNPTGCVNQRQCSDTTNNIGCHNYGTCYSG